jgi:hypothetical protein
MDRISVDRDDLHTPLREAGLFSLKQVLLPILHTVRIGDGDCNICCETQPSEGVEWTVKNYTVKFACSIARDFAKQHEQTARAVS